MPQVKRLKKTTLRQYEIMLDFLQNHPEMISGKITDSFTSRRREELWGDLSIVLNSVGCGPQKTPLKWRRTWIDIKCETKMKVAELIEQHQLNETLNPPRLPMHLDRIRRLIGLPSVVSNQNANGIDFTDQHSIRIKECFTEEISPDTDVQNNGNLELDKEITSAIKIEKVFDCHASPEQTSCENVSNIPSTSTETPCEKVSNSLTTSTETSCEKISDSLYTSAKIPCRKESNISLTNPKTPSEKKDSIIPTETPYENISDTLSTSAKTPCEKVCHTLTTSVKKLNEVIKNSENRTITAFNALTKATVKANELHEKQLQIEEERNRLYRERNEILFTLVNAFIEKKVNHQY